MADVTSTQTAASSGAAATNAAVPATVGQSIDAEIVVLKGRLAKLEAGAKTDWSIAVAWIKSNWAHVALTWPAAVTVLKPVVLGLLKTL